jgi:hypothetical protein
MADLSLNVSLSWFDGNSLLGGDRLPGLYFIRRDSLGNGSA